MSLDTRYLEHDFDEETLGFQEPAPSKSNVQKPVLHRLGQALVLLGLVASAVLTLRPHFAAADSAPWSDWPHFLTSYGALFVGGLLLVYARYAGATPGIRNDNQVFGALTYRGFAGWMLGVLLTGIYVGLYFESEIKDAFGLRAYPLAGLIDAGNPVARLMGVGDQGKYYFLYSMLYTLSVIVFAVRMVFRYQHNRYQLLRTGSVTFFQLGIAFLLPQLLAASEKPEFYFSYFWPLSWEAMFPSKLSDLGSQGTLGQFMVGWSFAAAFLAVPILTYYFGKRWYCSWVCGCGGLAETMGDPFRQLSDKSTKAWKFERVSIYSVLVAIVLLTISMAVFPGAFSLEFKKIYFFLIMQMFAGVIGTGFYPLLGNRAWCRFGCPQAAILGILQRYFSRFRITTNGGQCMSCGNCSTYCEMGIDVRAYAQAGENVVRASCVGCGICSAVCPRGVLKLENGSTSKDRYDGAATPVDQLLKDLKEPPRPVGSNVDR
ncbi:MAG: 4Fe-4S binding protein [Planctomycetota bacterium]